MGYLSYPKTSKVKLSNNFTLIEFSCQGGGCCSTTVVNEDLVKILQKISDHFDNVPITITSGYRCPVHNRNVGGATGSRHTKGDAADIVVSGHTPREVAKYAESIGVKGIGLYETSADGYFVHVDTRPTKSFWYGQSQKYMATFANLSTGSSNSGSSGSSDPSNSDYLLYSGSKGQAVKSLQQNLIKLGYDCGAYGADGVYGSSTVQAVKKFQKDHDLPDDGIAGNLTLTAVTKAISELSSDDPSIPTSGKVRVTASGLYVRSGVGTHYSSVKVLPKNTICEIVESQDGWGKLKDGSGWICLEYTEKA